MRVAFVSACDPVDRFLVAEVAARWPPVGILRPVWTPPRRGARRALELARAWPVLRRRAVAAWYRGYFARLDRTVSRALLGPRPPRLSPEPVAVAARAIHDPGTVALVAAWRPDVLVVSGAPILKPPLYALAGVRVNAHLGIAPAYRGHHALFWPLWLRDYGRIGATLHHLEEAVDAGAPIARVYPALERADTEATLLVKCARLLAPVLVEFLDAVERGAGTPAVGAPGRAGQDPVGRVVAYGERTLRHDLAVALRRAVLRQGPPARPARVERYF